MIRSRNSALVIAYLIHDDLVWFRAINFFDSLSISENRSGRAWRYSCDNISYVITNGYMAVIFTKPLCSQAAASALHQLEFRI